MSMPVFRTTTTLNIRSGPGVNYDDIGDIEGDMLIEELPTSNWCPILLDDDSVGWLSREYLILESEEELYVPPTTSDPPHIKWARQHLGQKEVPGPASNPVIQSWYHLTTLPEEYWTDSTAWCAVFVNAALMLNNIKTIRSAKAFDWLKWGIEVDTPQKGDVVIFDFSHVAFYLSEAENGRIKVIGGNQNDAVTETTYSKQSVLGYRRVP